MVHTSFRESFRFQHDCIHDVNHCLSGVSNTRISLQCDFRPISHCSGYLTDTLHLKVKTLLCHTPYLFVIYNNKVREEFETFLRRSLSFNSSELVCSFFSSWISLSSSFTSLSTLFSASLCFCSTAATTSLWLFSKVLNKDENTL